MAGGKYVPRAVLVVLEPGTHDVQVWAFWRAFQVCVYYFFLYLHHLIIYRPAWSPTGSRDYTELVDSILDVVRKMPRSMT